MALNDDGRLICCGTVTWTLTVAVFISWLSQHVSKTRARTYKLASDVLIYKVES